jgi:hypothetical protein
MSCDLPGVNPATLNEILLYYHLMNKWSGLGNSTELSRVGLSQNTCNSYVFKILQTEMEALKAEPIPEGEMPASSVQVVLKVLA